MAARYRLLAAQLRDAITAGEYVPGSRLPAIADIATEMGMGRQTVSAAIALLEAEGLVRAVQGTGTVVLDRRPVQVAYSRYAGVVQPGSRRGPWEAACEAAGIPGRMDVLEVERMAADAATAALLGLPPAGVRIVRRYRRAMLGEPEQAVQLHTASYPARLVRGTPIAEDAKVEGGIYAAFTAAGIPPAAAAETVGARPASDEEAAELHLRGGTVLTVQRITRDAGGRALELLEIVADPARTTLVYDPLPLQRTS